MESNITNEKHKSGLKRNDIIEPELSYEIVGLLFRVFNELGPGLKEKNYQKALSVGLSEKNINFEAQVPIKLEFSGKFIGNYFADFIIDNKIIVELKTGSQINRKHALQLNSYLKTTNLKLGMLSYFGKDGVFFKRILNLY